MTARPVLVTLTVLAALMLVMVPLPDPVEPFRPDWVTMVMIYWAIALPPRFGLTVPFLAALLLDVARADLLGQNALGLVFVAALAIQQHQRLRVAPLMQQAVVVLVLLTLKQLLVLWISGIVDRAGDNLWLHFVSPVVGMLFWPVVFVLLRDLRRRYQPA